MLAQLPCEIGLLIANSLGSDTDISSFARTSRVFYDQVLNFLYKNGQKNSEGQALIWACSEGEERTAELAMRNFNTDNADTHIWVYGRALSRASANGHLKLVTTILQKIETLLVEWDPYDCDDWVDIALIEAARYGHQSIVQLLVEAGGDIEINDEDGTPLIHATAAGHGNVVEYLLKRGAHVHCADKYGRTALHAAASKGDVKATEALIRHGAKADDVNPRDEDRNTALLLAAMEGHEGVVQFLLNQGANDRHINNCGDTALRLAEENGHENVAKLLR
ncbi:ankyrin repeat-containing domain protein [Aspergillus spectabilis]